MSHVTQTAITPRPLSTTSWSRLIEPEFQRALKLDAHTALQERFGISVPADLEIRVDTERHSVVLIGGPRTELTVELDDQGSMRPTLAESADLGRGD